MTKTEAGLDLAIERRIYTIRGERVMLDRDLAKLYGVKAIALRQTVKRNLDRFPGDFVFRLTLAVASRLVSQSVIPSRRSLGGSLPQAFTEHGVAMLSSVLRGSRAVAVNVEIIRVFVRLRALLATDVDLVPTLQVLEQK